MAKQTSIEWLVDQLPIRMQNYLMQEIEKAKQMHKQEIIDAFIGHDSDTEENIDVAEQYYQETYGGNK